MIQTEVESLKLQQTVGRDIDSEVAKLEKKVQQLSKIRPFHYSHQGSLAYVFETSFSIVEIAHVPPVTLVPKRPLQILTSSNARCAKLLHFS